MIALAMLVLGLAIGAVVARLHRPPGQRFELFYATTVLVAVGIGGILFGFIPHVFFPDPIAERIGWATGSPFQTEVGMHNGAWGVLGLLSFRYRQGFLQATAVGLSLFLAMAGANHLRGLVGLGNHAPFNVQFIAGDWVPAAVLLTLAWKYRRLRATAPA